MILSTGYNRELTVATEAAVAAGAILREEFNRPLGPQGPGDHAATDEVAEQAILEYLTARFPHDGFLGEELGRAREPQDDSGRLAHRRGTTDRRF
jgi:fructose-1,6-bisphosphatase/inositol monophosphatase family enzyme